MNVSTNSIPLIVAEPNSDTKRFRESLLQFVESNQIPKIFIAKKGALNAYSKGQTNVLIFESGAISSNLVVVDDGYVLQETYTAAPFGGDTITEMIAGVLDLKQSVPSSIQLNPKETYTDSFYSYFRLLQAEEIKHSLLNLDPNRSLNGWMEKEYVLPDGEQLTMTEDDQVFCRQLFSEQRTSIVRTY